MARDYEQFFSQLRGRLRFTETSWPNCRQIGTVSSDPVLISFVPTEPGCPLRLEWTLQKGGAGRLNRLKFYKSKIESEIGSSLVWDERAGSQRAILSLYYDGEDTDEARVDWVVKMAPAFRDVIEKYNDKF